MGSIQFAVSFQERYGAAHPDFFPGTLEQAFKEACYKPAKDVRGTFDWPHCPFLL